MGGLGAAIGDGAAATHRRAIPRNGNLAHSTAGPRTIVRGAAMAVGERPEASIGWTVLIGDRPTLVLEYRAKAKLFVFPSDCKPPQRNSAASDGGSSAR